MFVIPITVADRVGSLANFRGCSFFPLAPPSFSPTSSQRNEKETGWLRGLETEREGRICEKRTSNLGEERAR